jgi:hypothetical protein
MDGYKHTAAVRPGKKFAANPVGGDAFARHTVIARLFAGKPDTRVRWPISRNDLGGTPIKVAARAVCLCSPKLVEV